MAEHDARRIAHTASFAPLWNRIVAVLKGEFFTSLRPGALLGTACICCGRPLTDPISQARFIGPECYGSASKDARWIYILQPAQNVAVTRQSDELAELEEMLRTRLVIDIETRSSADLKKVGSAVYAQEPTTSITHVGYRNGQGGSHVWQPARSPMPSDLADALADDRATLVAHNVSFERAVLSGHAGRAIGIPPSINQLRRWSCTAA